MAVIAWMLGASATAVAATQVRGNPQGIALAGKQVTAYAKIDSETVTETGYVAMTDGEGRSSFFQWQWGSGSLPHGWVPATEHAVVALRHNRIVWWRDDLTPPACHGKSCSEVPVDVVIDRKGAFFAFGSARHHSCYGRLRGSTPVKIGTPWAAAHGDYQAPVTQGSDELLTYSYPWGPHQTATETDTISQMTLLDARGVIHVAGGGVAPLTVRFTNGHPAKAPKAPVVKLCTG
ncbi:MAG: hypothetical protein ACRDL5_01925 [Solirubrobacteraceae bacterium]